MYADYQIIEPVTQFVWGQNPFSKTFVMWKHPNANPWLMMAVKTFYTDFAEAASVQINGTEIAKIFPLPGFGVGGFDMETVVYPFSAALLNAVSPPLIMVGVNVLDIVPAGQTYLSSLFVGNVILHYRAP